MVGPSAGDMWEVGLWQDGQLVVGSELFYNDQVYNQAIVVPETIDASRALTGIEIDGARSIAKTDQAMDLVMELWRREHIESQDDNVLGTPQSQQDKKCFAFNSAIPALVVILILLNGVLSGFYDLLKI